MKTVITHGVESKDSTLQMARPCFRLREAVETFSRLREVYLLDGDRQENRDSVTVIGGGATL